MLSKNILQVCLSRSWGGLEMVAYETAFDLQKNGFDCLTLVAEESPLAQRLKQNKIAVAEINPSILHLFRNIRYFKNLLITHKIQTVIAQHLRELPLIRLSLRSFDTVKLVGYSHTFVNVSKKDFFHRWLYQRMNYLIALTDNHKENLLQHVAIDKEKLTVIPNFVDTEIFNPLKRNNHLRQSFDSSEKCTLIGLIGRLDKAKGQSTLIKAAALLVVRQVSRFKIILVGEETMSEPGTLEELKNLTKKLNLENHIIFTGYRSDIPEIMASMDIVVMASDAETFGRVNIEAMASGTVVVATRAGGVTDIIDHSKTGLLFKPRDEHELAQRLEYLIQNPSIRESLAQAALVKVQKKYAKKVVQKILLGSPAPL